MANFQSTTSNDRLNNLLSRLQSVKQTPNGWQAKCPAHDDKTASLSVSISGDGVILTHCHAGCDFKSITQALGMESRDFFPPKLKAVDGGKSKPKKKVVTQYDYRDENGDLLYQKIRYEPKEFRVRRTDGAGGWRWNLSGCRRVLYRLPELIQAVKNGETVFIVEGEKDVETLISWELKATCNFDGAGKWNESYNGYFKGATVINLRDNDLPGEKHGNLIGENLSGQAAVYKSILLPDLPEHGDVTDWANSGGAKEKLLEIVATSPAWEPSEESVTKPKIALISDAVPDAPVKLIKPPFWNVDKRDGVWIETDKEGHICACPVPVILHRRLKNIDTLTERIEIALFRDDQWRTIIADYSTIFNSTNIIALGERGLPVSSTSAKYLVQYLTKLQEANLNDIPTVNSVSRMGWATDKNFLPGAEGDIVLDSGDFRATDYHSSGDFEAWKEIVGKIRNDFPFGRLFISAGFAAPLLKILSQRVFVIHLWGPSRGGKTAVLKAALSIWGEPDELIVNFNSTKVGLERLASYHCDLPLGIDERQAVGDKQGFLEGLIYLLGLGKGKTRGAKSGGLQNTLSWRTIALTTGEEPISSESSTAGINTRVIELYGQPINDDNFSRNLHIKLASNYGFAGEQYIKKLIECDKADLKQKYESIVKLLAAENPDKIASHIPALATITIADYLSSMWIWGLSEEEALLQASAMAKNIASKLATASEADDSNRAYDYLMSQFMGNYRRFSDGNFEDKYGFHDATAIYFYPHIFNQLMDEGGFNPTRMLRDWAEQDLIETDTIGNSGKRRFKIRKNDPYTKLRTFFISIRKKQEIV
jgi:putative DNA primase/helicase